MCRISPSLCITTASLRFASINCLGWPGHSCNTSAQVKGLLSQGCMIKICPHHSDEFPDKSTSIKWLMGYNVTMAHWLPLLFSVPLQLDTPSTGTRTWSASSTSTPSTAPSSLCSPWIASWTSGTISQCRPRSSVSAIHPHRASGDFPRRAYRHCATELCFIWLILPYYSLFRADLLYAVLSQIVSTVSDATVSRHHNHHLLQLCDMNYLIGCYTVKSLSYSFYSILNSGFRQVRITLTWHYEIIGHQSKCLCNNTVMTLSCQLWEFIACL